MRPGSVTLLPVSTTSTGLLCLLVGAHGHCGRSDTEVSVWLLPCAYHIWWVTILGIPRWVPAEDTQAKVWVKARLSCNHQSSSVDCRNFREGQYTLLPEGFSPGSLYACAGLRSMCNSISRRKGWIGIITLSHCTLP